jgi:hypothetical protein
VEIAPEGARASISLRPVPPCEPPFDDEIEPLAWVSAHQLALDWSRPALLRAAVAASEALTAPAGGSSSGSAGGPASLPAGVAPFGAAGPAPAPPVAEASHDARLAVHHFVRACVEVLNGHRPPAHLRRLSVPAVASAVVTQALIGARRVAHLRKAGPGRRSSRRPSPVAVIRLRMCEPRPGVVEAAVALVTGERTWAMALRMELHQDAWSATILRLI